MLGEGGCRVSSDRARARRSEASSQTRIAVRQLATGRLLAGASRPRTLRLWLVVPALALMVVGFVGRGYDAVRRDLASLIVVQRGCQRRALIVPCSLLLGGLGSAREMLQAGQVLS